MTRRVSLAAGQAGADQRRIRPRRTDEVEDEADLMASFEPHQLTCPRRREPTEG